MAEKFILRVPKKPFLRRATYDVPSTYLDVYQEVGITDSDELIMLFHTTQFGGFRIGKIPSDLRLDEKFIKQWFIHEYENGCHKFRANMDFILKFGDIEIKPLLKRWRNVAVDYEAMFDEGFSLEEVNEALDLIWRLNEFYSSVRIDIEPPKSGISAEDRIRLSRFHGIPYLVKKPKAGGRLFNPETSYQRISHTLRQMMTINDERTSEIDLTAATMQFLNIALKRQSLGSLEKIISSNGDPYQYFLSTLNSTDILRQYDEQPMERELFKVLLYTAVYSSENKQEINVNRKLRLMGRRYKYDDLVSFFPRFFNSLSALRHKTGLPLHMVIYKEESRYAQQVLKKGCLEEKLPILPLHDSFIVPVSNIDGLKKIMDSVSMGLYGKHLSYKQRY